MGAAIFGHEDVNGEIRICGRAYKILGVSRVDYQHNVHRFESTSGISDFVAVGLADITFRGVHLQPAFALSDAEWATVSAIAAAAGTASPRWHEALPPVPNKAVPESAIAMAARVFLEAEALREEARQAAAYYDYCD